jgi:hypothetical protein
MALRISWLYIVFLFGPVLLQILLRYPTNAPVPILGLETRCNRTASCQPAQRTPYDATFLCCEDGPFVISHVAAPMVFSLFLGDPFVSLLGVAYWEYAEGVSLTLTGSYGIFPSNPIDYETPAGLLLGDGFINGMLGVLIGTLITSYSGFPGILPFIWRNGAVHEWTARSVTRWVAVKYLFLMILNCVPFLFCGNTTASGVIFGPYITAGLLALTLFLFTPLLLRDTDVPGYDMPRLYWRMAPLAFLVFVILSLGAVGWEFLANDYFQVWLFYYVATLVVIGIAYIFPRPLAKPAVVTPRAKPKQTP